MMFLQYATQGCWWPVLPLHLAALGIDAGRIGIVMASAAMAAIFAPLIVGRIADRLLAPERCLGLCHLTAGAALWAASYAERYPTVLAGILLYWMLAITGGPLTNTISFHHLQGDRRRFGPIRLWGTAGWIFGGLAAGVWLAFGADWAGAAASEGRLLEEAGLLAGATAGATGGPAGLGSLLRLGALFSFALALYAPLALPATAPAGGRASLLNGLQPLLRSRSLALIMLAGFVVTAASTWAGQLMPRYLMAHGVAREWVPPVLTLGQLTELASLAALPWLISRLGMTRTIILGVATWCLRYALLTGLGGIEWGLASLTLHGLGIACYYVAAQIYTDSCAAPQVRASAQGLLSVVNAGFGALVGNLLSGWTIELMHGQFSQLFVLPSVGVALVLVPFALFFRAQERPAEQTPAEEHGAVPEPRRRAGSVGVPIPSPAMPARPSV